MVEYKVGREKLLKNKLDAVRDHYDYIVIDCPPSLGLLNTNALTAADSELVAGKKFSKDFSPVEDKMSRQVGDIHFMSPFSMRNEWTTIRIKHEVPGNIDDMKILMGIPVVSKDGTKTTMNGWMHYVDFKIEEEFSEEKNHAIIYSRTNRDSAGEYHNIGKSGNVIRMGSGIREQMEVSNTQYYGKFSIKLIEDMLYSL